MTPPTSPSPPPVALPPVIAVRFDDTTAARLAAALDELAEATTACTRACAQHAAGARVDWAGHTRDWFDHRLAGLATDARGVAATARAEAGAVGQARAWAVAETARRLDEATRAAQAEEARLLALAEPAA